MPACYSRIVQRPDSSRSWKKSLGSLQLRTQFTTSLGCFSLATFLPFPCDLLPFLLPNTLSFLDTICFRTRSRSLFPSQSGPLWGLMFSPQRAAFPVLPHVLMGRKTVAGWNYSQEPSRDILRGLDVLKKKHKPKMKPRDVEDLIGFMEAIHALGNWGVLHRVVQNGRFKKIFFHWIYRGWSGLIKL